MANPGSCGYVNKELNLKCGFTEFDGKKQITRTPQRYTLSQVELKT